jgi:peptide/nickel transport system ATP-binding protein
VLPLLRISNLRIDFETETGTVTAVSDINLVVSRNEILGIAGESGSGKSVTSLAILQLLSKKTVRYIHGEITFSPDGVHEFDMLKVPRDTLRSIRGKEIGMIFQEPMTSLNPVFTCGAQVMEAIQLHQNISGQVARHKTIELFRKVKLPDPEKMIYRYPHQLSGGQKQRVMIAMAMSGNPSLLICDEPTTALDVQVQKTILDLIRDLQKETGMGVIFITHDLGVIGEIANRVIIMYKGKIMEEGNVNQVFEVPNHPYTKSLLLCRPALYPKGIRLPVVSDFWDPEKNNEQRYRKLEKSNSRQESGKRIEDSHEQKDALIRVENLSVWFPSKKSFTGKSLSYLKAVDDVSFEVFKGETLGLVGGSGSGKTTLGRTLLRLIEPTAGTIFYDGVEFSSMKGKKLKDFRRNMQIVFQDPYSSLNPSIPIGSAIMEPLTVHEPHLTYNEKKFRVVELIKKVGLLAEHYNRYPHEFSGGQRQRIVIARALVLRPSFIICDESVSALDVSVQAQILNLLNDLKRDLGFTSIFISHDLSVVKYLSDRIITVNNGKIAESL